MALKLTLFILLIICDLIVTFETLWSYECVNNTCVKTMITEDQLSKAISISVCRLFCDNTLGILWPKPTGSIEYSTKLIHINVQNIEFNSPLERDQNKMWELNKERFISQLINKSPEKRGFNCGGKKFILNILVHDNNLNLKIDTNEEYNITTKLISNGTMIATIFASTYFGARHGLETLSQLIVFDDIRMEYLLLNELKINDAPAFAHRGLLLDTSRNFFSIDSIKRTLDAMAMTKLNTFHWHITDSQSFPLLLESQPNFAKYGAYSKHHLYTPANIVDVVKYAKTLGIRIIPEFDAPAHVGEGWQNTNLTVCFNKQPWVEYCVEPPCGQLNPTIDQLYDILEDIYSEMMKIFDYPDMFHMGGDEVSFKCWETSKSIQDWLLTKNYTTNEKGFMFLWNYFQTQALSRLDKVTNNTIPIIMWTSHLTDPKYVLKYLNQSRYIIQVWTSGSDEKIQFLLNEGYKLILSNYDALYLDCGFGGWVQSGNNWCSPYIGWEKVYMNSPDNIAKDKKSQILGAEAALWTEQADEYVLDSRIWPRTSALAERLWTNPRENWRQAESRMLMHRQRLVENNISPERLQPEWCRQNQNECPLL